MSDKMKNIYIAFLTLVCFIVIFFIGMVDCLAFEITQPIDSTTYKGTTYYRYKIPTRYADQTESGMSVRTFMYGTFNANELLMSKKDYLTLVPSMNNFSYTNDNYNVWSTYLYGVNTGMSYITTNGGKKAFYGNFNFYMGTSGLNSDMLSNGGSFNYDNYYDFKFDIIGFSNYENMKIPGKNVNSQMFPSGQVLGVNNTGDTYVDDIGYCTVYDYGYGLTSDINIGENEFSHFTYARYICTHAKFDSVGASMSTSQVDYNQPYKGKITQSSTSFLFSACNNSDYSASCHKDNFKYIISQPFDIYAYSTSSSMYTDGSIISQNDIDTYNGNFARGLGDTFDHDSFIDQLFNLDFLGNFNIQNIINTFKDFFQNTFNSNTTYTCTNLTITIYGKQIIIPCGYSFWSRTDINSFRITWEMVFNCLISVFVIRAIFNEIINIFNPNSLGLQSEVMKL